jgi:isoquinoline 1-oxidoreductase beta subunit
LIRLAAEKSGWDQPLPKGEGRGIAFHYSHSGLRRDRGGSRLWLARRCALKIRHVTAVADVGPIINLSGAENQIQGSIIDGLGMAWLQEITHDTRPRRAK